MQKDCKRISTSIKVDYRKGAKDRITGKIESVEKRLGRKVKK
ncbi:MAG: thiamine-binding protein [Deltaproteobacteria bacterium]